MEIEYIAAPNWHEFEFVALFGILVVITKVAISFQL